MKTILQVAFVAFLVGGLSTAGTVYWQKQKKELDAAISRAEAAEKKAAENPLEELQPSSADPAHEESEPEPEEKPPPPVAVRPPYVEGADETSRLIVSLNERLTSTFEKEKRLNERQEVLKLIFADIRSEQTEVATLRKQLGTELDSASQSVQDALDAAEKERELLRQELEGLRKSPPDSIKPPSTAEPSTTSAEPNALAPSATPTPIPNTPTTTNEPASATPGPPTAAEPAAPSNSASANTRAAVLKRMGSIYDSMPPDVVAEVFLQLNKDGRQDAVVQLLKAMKDRQAAKVLTAIAGSDPASAATLTDQLKRE